MKYWLAMLLAFIAGCSSAPTADSASNDWLYGTYAGQPVKSGPGM